jgi:hypothetical protein
MEQGILSGFSHIIGSCSDYIPRWKKAESTKVHEGNRKKHEGFYRDNFVFLLNFFVFFVDSGDGERCTRVLAGGGADLIYWRKIGFGG